MFEPFANYRHLIFGRPNFKTDGKLNPLRCQIPWGKGKVQPDGVTLIMDYQIWDPSKNQFVNDQFIGIKNKDMKVKIYFLIFFVMWFFMNHIQAQCYWDSNKGINTTLGSTFNAIPDFNWKSHDYLIYTKSNQTIPTIIKSPFTGLSNANENIDGFIRQDVKDYEPSEGWEMLIRNFGAPNDPYKFPTLVLYNRYLGIIRTFVYAYNPIVPISSLSKNDRNNNQWFVKNLG